MPDDEEELESLLSGAPTTDPGELRAWEAARLGNLHYSAIGQIAAQWAYFEAIIDSWLISYARIEPKVGICFTAQMIGLRPRLDAFIALAKHLGADKRWNQTLEDFARDANGLSQQRNRAVHDVWELTDPTSPHRWEATAQRSLRYLKHDVSTEELRKLVDNIIKLQARFDDMAATIFSGLHTLPDTLPSHTEP
jgi:hypothetical protein